MQNQQSRKGRRVGRRLYLFFAGHGIAPFTLSHGYEEAALLMADAAEGSFGNHVVGRQWLDWFYQAGYFQELALFMDCCRDVYFRAQLLPPHLDQIVNRRAMAKAKRLLAFATKWSSKSRERPVQELMGQVRGVFTLNLMKGLRGGASSRDGRITAESLKRYLYNIETVQWRDQEDQDLPTPDVEVLGNGSDFVLAHAPVPKYWVNVHIPTSLAGRKIVIIDGEDTVLASALATPPIWRLELGRGLYQVVTRGGGPEPAFAVKGEGEVDVRL